jgi:putative lipoprotein
LTGDHENALKTPSTTIASFATLVLALALGGCTGNGPTEVDVTSVSPAPASRVSGTVAYRERMALPADATVDLWITDIGSGVVTMAILGETTVPANGRQVPLPFELAIDPSRVNADRPYGIRAVIRAGGQTVFETREATPVLTQGQPATVVLMLNRVAAEAAAPTLVGTAWRLEDLGGAGVVSGAEATLEFPEAGRVAGRGSCNRFFGPVTITGTAIQFGLLGSTQMACPEPVAAQETTYFAALRAAERFEVAGATLRVYSKGVAAPLRFVRTAP